MHEQKRHRRYKSAENVSVTPEKKNRCKAKVSKKVTEDNTVEQDQSLTPVKIRSKSGAKGSKKAKKSKEQAPLRAVTPMVPHRYTSEKKQKPVTPPVLVEKKASDLAAPAESSPIESKCVRIAGESVSESVAVEPVVDDAAILAGKQAVCREWFARVSKIGLRSIRKEFIKAIKNLTPDVPIEACKKDANQDKNRYNSIFLADDSRVKIHINPKNDDYIHASFVNIGSKPAYICAQGPMSNTIEQFWLMCIQERVEVILQLCQNVENYDRKCDDYLPTNFDTWTEFGSVKVKLFKESTPILGLKSVIKTIVTCKFNEKESLITHLLYTGWPDHAAPESIPTCREVRTLVSKMHKGSPVVVHCSAGVGRTGTFVAIEYICHKLLVEKKSEFDMIDVMRTLRTQRLHAVQNDTQYTYIFRGVIEVLVAEEALTNTPDVIEFINDYEKLNERRKKRQKAA